MITNEEINGLKNAIKEQTVVIREMVELNKEQFKKIDLLIENRQEERIEDMSYSEDGGIKEGDYISYYSNTLNKIVIGKIIGDGNDNYQVFYPSLNASDYCCYQSIEELLYDYIELEDFMTVKTGEYSNMIPKETTSYIVYEERNDGEDIWRASIFKENGKMLLCDEMGNAMVEGKTYEELIFKAMMEYSLVIPLRTVPRDVIEQ